MPERIETDVVIVGAGPVGLFAAFECGMLRLSSILVDALADVGGQLTALYPEKPIYDIPGRPSIPAASLIADLEAQIAPFAVPRLLGRQLVSLTGKAGNFALGTDQGEVIGARAVIVAAGAGAFGPNRPPLAGIAAYEATGSVQYWVRRREDLRGRRVVIAGGGDSAVDWALSLAGVASHVAVVHRRAKFRASPESARQLEQAAAAGAVALVVPYQLHALHGENGRLASVEVADMAGAIQHLPADVLLPFFGLATDLGPLAGWGLGLVQHRVEVAPATCETRVAGVYAIGDVACYPGKLKLILQGFSEAAMAAHALYPLARPGETLHFEHSTSRGLGP